MNQLPEFAVRRPIGVTMLFCIVLVLGGISIRDLSIDLLPDITFPALAVVTGFEGVGPEDVENLLTKPIEEAISRVDNIKEVRSESMAGLSIVMADFNWGTNLDLAAQDVRDRLDLIEGSLPEDADSPVLLKMNLKNWPVMYLGLTGNRSLESLKRLAEKSLKPEIEKVEGVAQVDVAGGLTPEVKVELDQAALQQYELAPVQVAEAIRQANLSISGGFLKQGKTESIIKLKGEVQGIASIQDILIGYRGGHPVFLKDVADVHLGYHDVSGKVRLKGKPAIGLIVFKQSAQNSVRVVDRIRQRLKSYAQNLPEDVEIVYSWDQARLIKLSVNSVKTSAYYGMLFTVLIIWFFLRSFRATVVVSSSIPFSIIGTFILMYFGDITINVMSLAGLALGVGVIVDNAIIVLENIYRLLEEGVPLEKACIQGAQEVMGAITASTLTNIAVFLPIAWVSGIVGAMFKELAFTVTFALLVSLIFALTLSPMLANLLFRIGRFRTPKAQSLGFVDSLHHRALLFSLQRPFRVGLIALTLMLLTILAVKNIGKEFMPAQKAGDFMVKLTLPVGTPLEETDLVARRMEEYLLQYAEIASLFFSIGNVREDKEGQAFGMGSTDTHEALGWAHLLPTGEGGQFNKKEIQAFTLKQGKKMPNVDVQVVGGEEMVLMGSVGKSIEITLTGDDQGVLQELSSRVRQVMENTPGVINVESSLKFGKPEVQVFVDRKRAADKGLTVNDVAQTIRIGFKGMAVTQWRKEGKDFDIFVRLKQKDRDRMEKLLQLTVPSSRAGLVRLGEITRLREGASIQKLERKNNRRMVQLTADVTGRDLGSVTADLKAQLKRINWPEGYSFSFGGKMEKMREAFEKLGFALMVAIVLVYMVLAFQFESFFHPFVIMFAVPFAFIGSIMLLFVLHLTLSVPSMMGLIMVVGIGVNDAIVLLDFIKQQRVLGVPRKEAILKAGATRLRPVLLTSATTIFALLPTGLGLGGRGGEMNIPLAYAIIGGLTSSTLLTLILVPTIYVFVDNFQEFLLRGLFGRKTR